MTTREDEEKADPEKTERLDPNVKKQQKTQYNIISWMTENSRMAVYPSTVSLPQVHILVLWL